MTNILLAVTLVSGSAQAGSGLFKNLVVANQGSWDALYDTVGPMDSTTDFDQIDLGTHCTAALGALRR